MGGWKGNESGSQTSMLIEKGFPWKFKSIGPKRQINKGACGAILAIKILGKPWLVRWSTKVVSFGLETLDSAQDNINLLHSPIRIRILQKRIRNSFNHMNLQKEQLVGAIACTTTCFFVVDEAHQGQVWAKWPGKSSSTFPSLTRTITLPVPFSMNSERMVNVNE